MLKRIYEIYILCTHRYSKRDADGKFVYYYHAAGYDPPFIPMPVATTATTEATTGVAAAQDSNPVVAIAQGGSITSPTSSSITSVAKDKKEKSHGKIKLDMAPLKIKLDKKTTLDINKWNDRKLEQDTPDTSTSKSGTTSTGVLNDKNGLLMKLGLDYSTLGCLRILSQGETDKMKSGPICDGSGVKWACLLSRRCFPTEEQLSKHIRLSKLYKEELTKAVGEGRIIRLT